MELLLLQAQQVLLFQPPLPSLHTPHPLPHPTTIHPPLRITPTFLNHPRRSVDSIQTAANLRVLVAVAMVNTRVLQHRAMQLDSNRDIHNTKLNRMPVKEARWADIKQQVHLQQEATSNRVQLEGLLLLHQDIKQASGTD